MDQFFTKADIAARCWAWLQEQVDLPADAHYVEPSVGAGAFYDLLPADRRTGFELDPRLAAAQGLEPQDFLKVLPLASPLPDRPLVFVGNPPFGYRARLAAAFVNHSFALGAEYVAMILPPMLLPSYAGGKPSSKVNEYVSVYKIDTAPNNPNKRCGLDRIEHCDYFIRDSVMRGQASKMRWVVDLPMRGYGLQIHKDRDRIKDVLEEVDWYGLAKKSLNNSHCLSKGRILLALQEELGLEPAQPGVLQPPDAESMVEGGHSIGVYEELDPAYELPEGGCKSIPHCGFVLYKKGPRPAAGKAASCSSYVDLWFIVDRDKRKKGLDKVDQCDCFLADTFYPESPVKPEESLDACAYRQATGIIIKKDRAAVLRALEEADWGRLSKGAPHGVRHITQRHIRQALLDAGLVDPVPAAQTCHSWIRLHGIGHYKERTIKDEDKIAGCDCFLPAATQEGHREGCRLMDQPGRMNAIGLELLPRPEDRDASCDNYVKLYHLQYGGGIAKHNERNAGKDEYCQVFIPQSLYKPNLARASTSKDWNQCIGVEILKERGKVEAFLLGYDWRGVGRPSPSGHHHITRPMVRRVLAAAGFTDERDRLRSWLRSYDWAGAAKRSTNRNLLLNRHIVWQAVIEGGFVDGLE